MTFSTSERIPPLWCAVCFVLQAARQVEADGRLSGRALQHVHPALPGPAAHRARHEPHR